MSDPDHLASVMIVVSGAAHAIVNAVLKAGRDKMSSRALLIAIFVLHEKVTPVRMTGIGLIAGGAVLLLAMA